MKTQVFDPFAAVCESGGCTFEPQVGWWTQVPKADLAARLGRPFADSRDAIYIPTIQKNGCPVAPATVAAAKAAAAAIGLNHITRATGMWVLSHTGEVQSETVWIAYGAQATSLEAVTNLARDIRARANQDAVAFECDGYLNFIAAEASAA